MYDSWDKSPPPVQRLSGSPGIVEWTWSIQEVFRPLRFVNKSLSGLASEYYFETLVIYPSASSPVSAPSYEYLQDILSSDPKKEYWKHAKRLVFRGSVNYYLDGGATYTEIDTCMRAFSNVQTIHISNTEIHPLEPIWHEVVFRVGLFPRLQSLEATYPCEVMPQSDRRFLNLSFTHAYSYSSCSLIAEQGHLQTLCFGKLYTEPHRRPGIVSAPFMLNTTSLRRLSLGALSVTGDGLASWIGQSKNTLCIITLQWMRLADGQWSEVFKNILACPKMDFLELSFLGYGSSSQSTYPCGQRMRRRWEPSRCLIQTDRAEDVVQLAKLQSSKFWYVRTNSENTWPWNRYLPAPTGIFAPLTAGIGDRGMIPFKPPHVTRSRVAAGQSVLIDD